MAIIGKDLDRAAEILKKGGLVSIPTETVYGLAANALSHAAVAKIFEAKKRPAFDPLIIHIPVSEVLEKYTLPPSWNIQPLIKEFWPGPVTLILPRKKVIPDIVTSGLDTVGVRVPRHPLLKELLSKLDFPLAAPSANLFGYVSPTHPDHVQKQLGDRIDYILDGGACDVGLESTIVGYENQRPTIYRKGGATIEAIKTFYPDLNVRDHSSSNPIAPGMLSKHYSPNRKLILDTVENISDVFPLDTVGAVRFKEYHPDLAPENQIILSPSGDLSQAARNLFRTLRNLEDMEAQVFAVELVPDYGLGVAINDRLKRACAE